MKFNILDIFQQLTLCEFLERLKETFAKRQLLSFCANIRARYACRECFVFFSKLFSIFDSSKIINFFGSTASKTPKSSDIYIPTILIKASIYANVIHHIVAKAIRKIALITCFCVKDFR